jgi:hypothetical protein
MGIKPGPSIRKTLADLLKARLDEQVITRQDEMEYIAKAYPPTQKTSAYGRG